MMNINVSNFIVITDGKLYDYRNRGKNGYVWTDNGYIVYPVGIAIPVIETRSRKCVGLGVISDIHVTDTTTSIKFEVVELDASTEKAYYNLYMQIKSMDNSESSYDTDVYIPGAMGLNPANKNSRRQNNDDDDDLDGLSLTDRMRRNGNY